jgi:hypothetical protein
VNVSAYLWFPCSSSVSSFRSFLLVLVLLFVFVNKQTYTTQTHKILLLLNFFFSLSLEKKGLILRLKDVISLIIKTSPDSPALYLSPMNSWKSHGYFKSMFGPLAKSSLMHSPSSSSSSSSSKSLNKLSSSSAHAHTSFGGNAAMGRLRGISYGVITEN